MTRAAAPPPRPPPYPNMFLMIDSESLFLVSSDDARGAISKMKMSISSGATIQLWKHVTYDDSDAAARPTLSRRKVERPDAAERERERERDKENSPV